MSSHVWIVVSDQKQWRVTNCGADSLVPNENRFSSGNEVCLLFHRFVLHINALCSFLSLCQSPRQICVLPLFCRIIFSRLKWELCFSQCNALQHNMIVHTIESI